MADCVNASESAITARSAASSCQKPSAAFKTSTAAIAAPSTVSPIRTETTVAATNMRPVGQAPGRGQAGDTPGRRAGSRPFSPWRTSRSEATEAMRPRSRSLSSARATSSTVLVWGWRTGVLIEASPVQSPLCTAAPERQMLDRSGVNPSDQRCPLPAPESGLTRLPHVPEQAQARAGRGRRAGSSSPTRCRTMRSP